VLSRTQRNFLSAIEHLVMFRFRRSGSSTWTQFGSDDRAESTVGLYQERDLPANGIGN
jgi:hypothetical protein